MSTAGASSTPELDKLHEAREQGSETIGEFIDWLQQHGYVIARWQRPSQQLEPRHLVYDQREPNRPGGTKPYHRTVAKSRAALCGAGPLPFEVDGQRRQGMWYGEHSSGPLLHTDLCAECDRLYQAGEWPTVQNETPMLFGVHKPIENWLAEYFGIDMALVDQERRAILDQIRTANKAGKP